MIKTLATLTTTFVFLFQSLVLAEPANPVRKRTDGIGDATASQLETESQAIRSRLLAMDRSIEAFRKSLINNQETSMGRIEMIGFYSALIGFTLPIVTSLVKKAGSTGRPVFGVIVGTLASTVSAIATFIEAGNLPNAHPLAVANATKELKDLQAQLEEYKTSESLPENLTQRLSLLTTDIESLLKKTTEDGEKALFYKASSAAHASEIALGIILSITGTYHQSKLTQQFGFALLGMAWLHNGYRMGLYAMNDQKEVLNQECILLRDQIRETLLVHFK